MGFLDFLSRRLPPEVEVLTNEIDRLRREYSLLARNVHDEVVINNIAHEATGRLRKQPYLATELIVRGGWTVPDGTLFLLSVLTLTRLRSGQYHLYRGVLSDQGNALMALFRYCVGTLKERGRFDQSRAADALREAHEAVKENG